MTSLAFPDINMWLAMAFAAHSLHAPASHWFESLTDGDELIFCRFTQLGLLRLLTQSAVMGDGVKTQREAWAIYDAFVTDGNARLIHEPRSLDLSFRRLASLDSASPQNWADCYLAAFAEAAELTLVTFDKALAGRAEGSILLQA